MNANKTYAVFYLDKFSAIRESPPFDVRVVCLTSLLASFLGSSDCKGLYSWTYLNSAFLEAGDTQRRAPLFLVSLQNAPQFPRYS